MKIYFLLTFAEILFSRDNWLWHIIVHSDSKHFSFSIPAVTAIIGIFFEPPLLLISSVA
jgi:hypothetical protein